MSIEFLIIIITCNYVHGLVKFYSTGPWTVRKRGRIWEPSSAPLRPNLPTPIGRCTRAGNEGLGPIQRKNCDISRFTIDKLKWT
jgi:hypothetical protein